jgi:ubiquinone biosynthesis protein COQ4
MHLKYKIDLLRTYKVFKKLRKNPTNTIFVFEILHSTNSPSLKWTYSKLLQTSYGGKTAYDSEEISSYFGTLAERPNSSVGKECHNLFPNQEILLKISRRKNKNNDWIEAKHPYNWMARRYRDTHDTWHTLTGYPANDIGEMSLAMFSFAQTKSIGWFLVSFAILLKYGVTKRNVMLMLTAYQNGKQAKFLLAENYDELFSENLEAARARLNINAQTL